MVFVLMANKEEDTYKEIFLNILDYITKNFEDDNFQLRSFLLILKKAYITLLKKFSKKLIIICIILDDTFFIFRHAKGN